MKRKHQKVQRVTKQLYESLRNQRDELARRLVSAERKAALWDSVVDAVKEAVLPDIEEKVADEVEDAVSGLSIS